MRIFSGLRRHHLLHCLLADESGFVVSSEAVLVGTVGILGATAGLSAISKSVDAELYEMASSIRHLDQSYSVSGIKIGDAWTAGSSYQQPAIEESMEELELSYERELANQKERAKGKNTDSRSMDRKRPDSRKPSPRKRKD